MHMWVRSRKDLKQHTLEWLGRLRYQAFGPAASNRKDQLHKKQSSVSDWTQAEYECWIRYYGQFAAIMMPLSLSYPGIICTTGRGDGEPRSVDIPDVVCDGNCLFFSSTPNSTPCLLLGDLLSAHSFIETSLVFRLTGDHPLDLSQTALRTFQHLVESAAHRPDFLRRAVVQHQQVLRRRQQLQVLEQEAAAAGGGAAFAEQQEMDSEAGDPEGGPERRRVLELLGAIADALRLMLVAARHDPVQVCCGFLGRASVLVDHAM